MITPQTQPSRSTLLWLGVLVASLLLVVASSSAEWLTTYPANWALPIQEWVDGTTDAFVAVFKPIFRAVSGIFTFPMRWLQQLLQFIPWPVTVGLFALTAYRAAGRNTAVFVAFALLFVLITGLWPEAMNTLALVSLAIPLSCAIGFGLGVWGFRSERANAIIQPTLDFMQTIPTFAYLLPILLLFGFGPIVGLIASAIFAIPPMVRNVILGLQQVPPNIREAGEMSGATSRQQFRWVEVPSALPQIMVGVNQTTMAAFSMIIIAAIIGGFADIGWEVLAAMRKAQFGQSLIAGLAIAFMAMMLDRITDGFAKNSQTVGGQDRYVNGRLFWRIAAGIVVVGSLIALIFPQLRVYPKEWIPDIANPMNEAILTFTANYSDVTVAIKEALLFYFMVPIRSGLLDAITPFGWGFEFTPTLKAVYVVLVVVIAGLLWWRKSAENGIAIALLGIILYFGLTTTPWLILFAVITLLAFQIGGRQVGLFAVASLLFILLSNNWGYAMLSLYLTGAAVIICIVVGGFLGVLAAENDRASAILRPLNDTFQTMPQFVLLIPALMLFKIGEFTALIAIIIYAIVPMIRYVEQGLRTVDPTIIEAGTAMGCTRWQMLWQVKIPQAIPVIMLGVNQTIMYALAMLVIAALVGTTGLGQQIYIGLGDADPGIGITAGLAMALIAMVIDRILSSWASSRKAALGL